MKIPLCKVPTFLVLLASTSSAAGTGMFTSTGFEISAFEQNGERFYGEPVRG
jgi:hypothetical protein